MSKKEIITKIQFLKAINLLINKPHVVNKKICGFHLLWIGVTSHILKQDNLDQIAMKLHDPNLPENNIEKGNHIIQHLSANGFREIHHDSSNTLDLNEIHSSEPGIKVIVRSILPKIVEKVDHILEMILIDETLGAVHYLSESRSALPKLLPELSYSIVWSDHSVKMNIWNDLPRNDFSAKWLQNNLLSCVQKWASQMNENNDSPMSMASLQLVDVQKYNKKYQNLKHKHANNLMKIWTECTDPQKYIYEDIAIASYLLVLWEQEREELKIPTKQSFLDLGCGNGLLVYLLTLEGHSGMGIDIKKRKIWDQFPPQVQILEQSIEPSDKHLYPDHDWLIGNHSDELTPWIPVIAAKSSMKNRFFVIPCCAFDFGGKFQRQKSGISQYAEYLDYVFRVGTLCGFEVMRDKLRIPSTKRICFVGQQRTFENENWNKIKSDIDNVISCKTLNPAKKICLSSSENGPDSHLWRKDFVSRDPVQKVRNCTQINNDIRDKMVNDVANLLLKQENFIKFEEGTYCAKTWNKGGSISMKSLVSILNTELKHLKSECGGLQTLLRNHRNVFIIESGNISLRLPESLNERHVAEQKLRSKKCWFFFNHPQGCVLKSEYCTYIH